jgi:hypothetical protein
VDGRPLTDNQLDFEDLVMFALDFGTPGPALVAGSRPAAAAADALALSVEPLPEVGGTFDAVLKLDGAGDVQALSASLDWDRSVAEPIAASRGGLLEQQASSVTLLSPAPGTVDVAALGRGQALTGSGELVHIRFRLKRTGDPAISLAHVLARDAKNRPLALGGAGSTAAPPPSQVMLAPSYPNPFTNAMTVAYGMPKAGAAQLVVFDIQGRVVRRMVDGVVEAGWHRVTWDGHDDAGKLLPVGAYVLRLSANDRSMRRSVRLVR